MPRKIDPKVKQRCVRQVLEHQSEYSSLTAAAEVVARRDGLGEETVRRRVRRTRHSGIPDACDLRGEPMAIECARQTDLHGRAAAMRELKDLVDAEGAAAEVAEVEQNSPERTGRPGDSRSRSRQDPPNPSQ